MVHQAQEDPRAGAMSLLLAQFLVDCSCHHYHMAEAITFAREEEEAFFQVSVPPQNTEVRFEARALSG